MALDPISAALDLGGKLIERIFPDPAQRDAAKLELAKAAQDGRLKEFGIQMSAIIAEANSNDPWTSRARPSFLYVIYTFILTAIPMGLLYAFKPEIALQVAAGVKAWLNAIPEEMWWLFGAGYLGYTGARGFEKVKKRG